MCGLFASRDMRVLKDLFRLNSRRGQRSISQTEFFATSDGVSIHDIHQNALDILLVPSSAEFNLVHIQAPTTGSPCIHPSILDMDDGSVSALWHNGILKEDTIRRLQDAMSDDNPWDTHLLHLGLVQSGPECADEYLSEVDGSFACFWYYKGQLYFFRNVIAPLFMDESLSFSSVNFTGAGPIPAGVIWKLDLAANTISDTGIRFSTKNNPYYL